MNKQEQIAFIVAELPKASAGEREKLTYVFKTHFGYSGDMSEPELLKWQDEHLEMLYKMMQGIYLTRQYVPDIWNNYASVQQLQSSVSFGRISEAEAAKAESYKEAPHAHYGFYEVPASIRLLYELEEKLGRAMDLELGLIMNKSNFQYRCTPPDFITFAHSGMDGIHYGFLTDFGAAKDLENAYIAVASPMDFDHELWIVARNIRDFIRIVCTDRSVLLNHFGSSEAYITHNNQHKEEESLERMAAARQMLQTFQLSRVEDLAKYMKELDEERGRSVRYRTLDTIGVAAGDMDNAHSLQEAPYNAENEAELIAALDSGDRYIRLAAVRDIQFRKLIPDDKRLLRKCVKALDELGLVHEAYQLKQLASI